VKQLITKNQFKVMMNKARFKMELSYVAIIYIAIVILTLTSCSKQELPNQDAHLVLIDLSNEEYYTFSDLNDPYMGWVKVENGEGHYSFSIDGNTITVNSNMPILEAYHIPSSTRPDRTMIPLPKPKTLGFSYTLEPGKYDEIFKIVYSYPTP
jgi:hypothetical protein